MKNNRLSTTALLNASGVLAYVFLIVTFLNNANHLFGPEDNEAIIPIAMLLLLVFSALLTGFLILGKPIMLYLDGKKKEALSLLFQTGGWLFVFIISVFTILLIVRP